MPQQIPQQRWRYNASGQFVDMGAEAAASWELADEIGRLKIADVAAPDPDDARRPARTPPKPKLPAADASPLDSASNPSVGSSPHVSDHPAAHSRGSSADTTLSSAPGPGPALLAHPPLKAVPAVEAKERPHSFSGGLSTADLRRLQQAGDSDHDRHQQQQQQQWYRDNAEQLSYPSLSTQVHRPVPQQQPIFSYPATGGAHPPTDRDREDAQLEYAQQRNYGPVVPHLNQAMVMPGAAPQFAQPRPTNAIQSMNYRQQPQRNFAPQAPAPAGLGYSGHTSHLSLGNTQQLYEMMMPPPPDSHHPAVARVQQQHNVFRATHHHSASDPSAALRDASLALLGNGMQGAFGGGMFAPAPLPQGIPPMYAGQYYSAQEIAAQQQVMAARLQAQYTGGYEAGIASPTSSSGQTGPSANNRKLGLYKTELCRSWEEKGTCRYSTKCQFAHGEDELRKVSRHPKYKTEICKTFWVSGSCPYGKRCCFIHTELTPGPGSGGTQENPSPQPQVDGRQRANSDPDTSASVSLLARISQRAAAQQEPSTPVDMIATNGYEFRKPPSGSLRVDTSVTDGPPVKQNKSAYPSFASNGILLPAPDHVAIKSPAPVTAGPDLGRHNNARMEIVGYANNSVSAATGANPRHSFSGTDGELAFSPSPPAGAHAFAAHGDSAPAPGPPPSARANGHVRAGSAGNWGAFARPSSHLAAASAFPHAAASPAGEIMGGGSPWSSSELAVGSSRLHEKAWA
ncbi:hypothetical protein HYPSUDRAFT_133723 [Hypholoma sublateritium FD-334 SS-4]|uniref:C3H1-type domain-containing protein n=1 Tax=Hypholoma sublateritium (strain FD-334 SS-4) TaxID=945553 RepID=A0A0D2Q380_HYPSF|nr:hypothetical protein HYPSUDRAFT_133723 [Hypholoma sublateritium FD-334 SS-4]